MDKSIKHYIGILILVIFIILIFIVGWIIFFDKSFIINISADRLICNIENKENLVGYQESEADIDKFYKGAPDKGNYIKYLDKISKQSRDFISLLEFRNLVGKTIIFDIDDTLVYTRPYHHEQKDQEDHPKYGKIVHYQGIEPIVRLAKDASRLGYHIIVITARPPQGYRNAMTNLNRLGIYPDALFTSLEWGQDPSFKAVMRNNLEYLKIDEVRNMSSQELFHYKPKRSKRHPFNLKLVMTIGDRWPDIVGMKDTLGLKLPETYDMNGYFWFNGHTRLIE